MGKCRILEHAADLGGVLATMYLKGQAGGCLAGGVSLGTGAPSDLGSLYVTPLAHIPAMAP